jgi:hypothetical protein
MVVIIYYDAIGITTAIELFRIIITAMVAFVIIRVFIVVIPDVTVVVTIIVTVVVAGYTSPDSDAHKLSASKSRRRRMTRMSYQSSRALTRIAQGRGFLHAHQLGHLALG